MKLIKTRCSYLKQCFSIVGTGAVLDIQVTTNKTRDLFVTKLRYFLMRWAVVSDEDDE